MSLLDLKKKQWVQRQFLAFLKRIIPTAIRTTLDTKKFFIIKTSRNRLHNLLEFLHSHLLSQYKVLTDIIVYDAPDTKYRFTVIYNLLSIEFNSRLLICTYTTQPVPIVTTCRLYASANWLEREV
jgi:NADH:ubiquinone oxidoreductase subunit C